MKQLFKIGLLRFRRQRRPRRVIGHRQRALRSGIVAIVAVAVVLGGIKIQLERNPLSRDSMYESKWNSLRAAQRETGSDRPVIFFGSSRVNYGFRAVESEKQLASTGYRLPVMNFGFPGGGPMLNYCNFERLDDAGIKPRLIIIEIIPKFACQSFEGIGEIEWTLRERFTSREQARWMERSRGIPRHWQIAPNSMISDSRSLVSRNFHQFLLTRERQWAIEVNYDPRGWTVHSKSQMTPERKIRSVEHAMKEHGTILKNLQMHGVGIDTLKEWLTNIQTKNLPVCIVLMPESKEFQTLYGPGSNDRLLAFCKSLHVPFVDARDWVPDDEFSDGHHLVVEGATRFTERFTREILIPKLQETE